MNPNKLLGVIKENSDTQEDLAKAIGISRSRLSAKIHEKDGASFTQPEILAIKRRYALNEKLLNEIFLMILYLNSIQESTQAQYIQGTLTMTEIPSCYDCAYGKREGMRICCTNKLSEHYGQKRKFAQCCTRFSEERALGLILGDENGEIIIENY